MKNLLMNWIISSKNSLRRRCSVSIKMAVNYKLRKNNQININNSKIVKIKIAIAEIRKTLLLVEKLFWMMSEKIRVGVIQISATKIFDSFIQLPPPKTLSKTKKQIKIIYADIIRIAQIKIVNSFIHLPHPKAL